jgi:hypothetical protein
MFGHFAEKMFCHSAPQVQNPQLFPIDSAPQRKMTNALKSNNQQSENVLIEKTSYRFGEQCLIKNMNTDKKKRVSIS